MGRFRKCISVQMKSLKFDVKDPIALLKFLAMFQTACDFNGIHEGANKWLFQMYTRGTAQDLLKNRMAGRALHREEQLSTSDEGVHFLLRTYATDDAIEDAHNDVVSYSRVSPKRKRCTLIGFTIRPFYAHTLSRNTV